jgi:hypothetical protein
MGQGAKANKTLKATVASVFDNDYTVKSANVNKPLSKTRTKYEIILLGTLIG